MLVGIIVTADVRYFSPKQSSSKFAIKPTVLNFSFKHLKKVLIIFINSETISNSKMNASSQYEYKCGLERVLI